MRLFLLLLLSVSFFPKNAQATHIVGGEMSYTCVGPNEIELELTVFRDCYNGDTLAPFDPLAFFAVYDDNWIRVDLFLVSPSPDDTLSIILTNPCHVAPPDVCVHRASYKQRIVLPSDTIGYKVVYQRCCRNELLRNIVSPLMTGSTFLVEITAESLQACNNSPKFKLWPPVSICVNEPIIFDHSAIDIDAGDEIVYELCTPYAGLTLLVSLDVPPPGPYDEVIWQPPYGLNDMLGGVPLAIDPVTGLLTGTPNTIGNFVVGICAKEYRDGVLMSIIRRDFQYNVADCGEPVSAFQLPMVQCDDLEVGFDNQSLFVEDGYLWYFDFENDQSAQSTDFEPTFTYPDTGTYLTALIVNPGELCTDTAFQLISLQNTSITADFQLTYPDCDSTLVISVQDLSYDSLFDVQSWDWTLAGPGGFVENENVADPIFEVTNSGLYKLTLVATASNGCTKTLQQAFLGGPPDISSLDSFIKICKGDSLGIYPGANANFDYNWSPNVGANQITAPNPFINPQNDESYSVTITNANTGCSTTADVEVEVSNASGGQAIASASPNAIIDGQSSQLSAMLLNGITPLTYVWSPASTLDDETIASPIAMPTDSTLYYVIITEANGCRSIDSVWVRVITDEICREPHIFIPTGFSPNSDGHNDVLYVEGNFIVEMEWIIYDRWGKKVFASTSQSTGWDGTINGSDLEPDTYGYYLRVLCPGDAEFVRKGNVTLLR